MAVELLWRFPSKTIFLYIRENYSECRREKYLFRQLSVIILSFESISSYRYCQTVLGNDDINGWHAVVAVPAKT